jgi:ATP-dependent Clp protease protease subunit
MAQKKYSKLTSKFTAAAAGVLLGGATLMAHSPVSAQSVVEPTTLKELFEQGARERTTAPDRTVRLYGPLNQANALQIIEKMKFLSNQDPDSDIRLLINSPGGDMYSAFAIYDVMQSLPNDIETVCEGMAMSAGAFLLTAGTEGKRLAYPNCTIMYHQPSGGAQGKITDMETSVENGREMKRRMTEIISAHSGWDPKVMEEMMERDFFIFPEEAKEMGFIDETIDPVKPEPTPNPQTTFPDGFCDKPGRTHISVCDP